MLIFGADDRPWKGEGAVEFREFDVVVLTEDLPSVGLTAGMTGTVVYVFRMPHLAYEVEFTDPNGATVAVVTVRAHQIAPAAPRSTLR